MRLILLIMILLPTLSLAVTPGSIVVNGNVETGQTLTITGTNLYDEDTSIYNSNWSSAKASFEGSTPAADGYTTSCMTYATDVSLFGSQSAYHPSSGATTYGTSCDGCGGCSFSYNPELADYAAGDEIYFRTYIRYDASAGGGEWPDSDHKLFWIGADPSDAPASTYFYNYDGGNVGQAPTRFRLNSASINGGNWIYSDYFDALEDNRWYLIELQMRKYNGVQGTTKIWLDDVLILDAGISAGGTGVEDTTWGWESDTNFHDTTGSFDLKQWDDGFAIASAKLGAASKVEIGDDPVYATATKVYQPPESIADGLVTVTVDLTGLGVGPYYLWVTNDKDERSLGYILGSSPGGNITLTGNSTATLGGNSTMTIQ